MDASHARHVNSDALGCRLDEFSVSHRKSSLGLFVSFSRKAKQDELENLHAEA